MYNNTPPNIKDFYLNNTIDNNFDVDFYREEYPDINNFYQPYCHNEGIDDRHRLFYHYKLYGYTNFKNAAEKNNQGFIPNISPRRYPNKLAVITSFFNPYNYANINKNYEKFAHHIQQYADLFPIELSFNNVFLTNHPNAIHIYRSNNYILWQKEALLNIALSKIPHKYTDVAWIDCDIIFENPDWIKQLYIELNKYKIVQLFKNAYKLDANGIKIPSVSLVSSFPNHGEAGFAWAARREVLDEIKLLDNQIFGGADYIMASAFMDQPQMIDGLTRYINNDQTQQWIQKTKSIVDKSVGYINTNIVHLYHGNIYNREYTRQIYRQKLINSININQDVTKIDGLWHIPDQHIDKILNYFIARQEDDNISIQYFLDKQFDSYEECLDFYIKYICDNVMNTSPSTITQIKDKMLDNIIRYAQLNSGVYAKYPIDTIFTRQHLNIKDNWICKNIPPNRIIHQHTSGSTTGEPFHYYHDTKYFDFVQQSSEFKLILKEYHLYDKPLKILNLFKHPYNPKPTNFYIETKNYSSSRFHTYGAADATTYFVNWDNYMNDPENWHNQLLDLLSNVTMDIVLGSGPVFNILCRYIKKNNFKQYFAYLISHTTEFPRIEDLQFLKDNGNITHYCDHMRCYDGGANFFTCKYGTYHLNDHLSWVTEGPDHKLLSTDYSNIVAPFINYWNGDLCEIQNEYQLCKCGRYYRPFKMLENRPFALKGPTKLTDIKKQIGALEYKSKLNQVQFENFNVNIYVNESLMPNELETLKNILEGYTVMIYDI